MTFEHVPVLFNEVIDSLNIKANGTYMDGTVGELVTLQESARNSVQMDTWWRLIETVLRLKPLWRG